MPWELGFEVAQAVPMQRLLQFDLCDGDCGPFGGLRNHFAIPAINAGDGPIRGNVRVSAADEIRVIFRGSGGGQERIAAPYRPGNDLRSAIAQFPGDLRKKSIVTDHHAEFPEPRLEHGVILAGRDPAFDLLTGKADFAIGALDRSVSTDKHGRIVDDRPFTFQDPRNDVEAVLSGNLAEEFRRWPRDRLARLHVRFFRAGERNGLRKAHDVGAVGRCLPNEIREMIEVLLRRPVRLRSIVDRGQTDESRRRRAYALEGSRLKINFPIDIPPIDEFEPGLCRAVGAPVGLLYSAPAVSAFLPQRGRILRVSDGPSPGVLPENRASSDLAGSSTRRLWKCA